MSLRHCATRTKDNQTCLELAIKRHLVAVVDQLCKQGAAVNETDDNGDCPLWQALDTGQEDIASLLVGEWGGAVEGVGAFRVVVL